MAVLEFLSLPLLVFLPLAFMVIIPNNFHRRRRHLRPSPIAMPLIGHFHLLSPVLHASFRDLSLRWGPIYSIRLGALPCVVVSSPELGRELLMTNELSFTSRIEAFAISRLTYATSTAFNPYDASFKFIHRLTMNEFLGNRPDLILAGLETAAATVEWMLSELINNPTVLEKARQEIDRVVGQTRLLNQSDAPNLPYIQAVIKEVLRLHPVSPVITRKCVKEHKVGKYVIPVDAILHVNNWSISRDPNYWESLLEFRPERFLQAHKEGSKTGIDIEGQHFELLPFGTGRRMCPGMSFSLQMLPIVAAAIIQCFDLNIVDSLGNKSDGHGSTVNMEEGSGTVVPKLHQLVCVPVARLNPTFCYP